VTESAHVTSIDSIASFRGALRTFGEDGLRALVMIDEQAKGALHWLEGDAVSHWREQVRRCFDNIGRTRVALENCRRRAVGSNRPACQEEVEAYRTAQRKLREAEEKIEVVRHWAQKVRQEIDDYRGRVMGLRRRLEGEIPRTLALLDRTVAALDSYADHQRNDGAGNEGDGNEDRGGAAPGSASEKL
jgi:hypothetical protein